MVEELMLQDLIQVRSSFGISRQYALYEVLRSIRDGNVIRERVAILSDSAIGSFHVGRFEGRLSYDQSVYNDSKGPNVYLV